MTRHPRIEVKKQADALKNMTGAKSAVLYQEEIFKIIMSFNKVLVFQKSDTWKNGMFIEYSGDEWVFVAFEQ